MNLVAHDWISTMLEAIRTSIRHLKRPKPPAVYFFILSVLKNKSAMKELKENKKLYRIDYYKKTNFKYLQAYLR